MTRIPADPPSFVPDAVAGLCDAHRALLRAVPGGVVRRAPAPDGKVAVVVGGGSGHYPAFAGYVGAGLADAAVVGNVFASPSARQVCDVSRAAHRGGGVLLAFGNYAGDVLNFGLAAERLRADGIDTRVLAVTDDIASAPADRAAQRRGIAGDVVVFKLAGAAAEAGRDLDEVEHVAASANDRTRSFGVAFAGCTLPGAPEPLFTVPDGQMGVGLGIHGEPGIADHPLAAAPELARLLVDRLLADAPADAGGRAAVLLNGLGATKYEELYVLWRHVAERLRAAGLEPVGPEVGELVTSLDMAGCSLTISWLDEEAERLWLAPAETPALRTVAAPAAWDGPTPPAEAPADPAPAFPAACDASVAAADRVVAVLGAVADALAEAEPELGRIDAVAGDGDHGRGMAAGSAAAVEAAAAARDAGAGAAAVLAAAADAWADRAGGTSGALWGVGLRAAAAALDDARPAGAAAASGAVDAALAGVVRLGGARPGDKTLVDALGPLAETLAAEVAAGSSLPRAWRAAAERATRAAQETAALTPRLGRARPLAERSVGHPDAGAVSVALCARTVADALDPEGDHRDG